MTSLRTKKTMSKQKKLRSAIISLIQQGEQANIECGLAIQGPGNNKYVEGFVKQSLKQRMKKATSQLISPIMMMKAAVAARKQREDRPTSTSSRRGSNTSTPVDTPVGSVSPVKKKIPVKTPLTKPSGFSLNVFNPRRGSFSKANSGELSPAPSVEHTNPAKPTGDSSVPLAPPSIPAKSKSRRKEKAWCRDLHSGTSPTEPQANLALQIQGKDFFRPLTAAPTLSSLAAGKLKTPSPANKSFAKTFGSQVKANLQQQASLRPPRRGGLVHPRGSRSNAKNAKEPTFDSKTSISRLRRDFEQQEYSASGDSHNFAAQQARFFQQQMDRYSLERYSLGSMKSKPKSIEPYWLNENEPKSIEPASDAFWERDPVSGNLMSGELPTFDVVSQNIRTGDVDYLAYFGMERQEIPDRPKKNTKNLSKCFSQAQIGPRPPAQPHSFYANLRQKSDWHETDKSKMEALYRDTHAEVQRKSQSKVRKQRKERKGRVVKGRKGRKDRITQLIKTGS